ncbi:hypothetical protein NC653_003786 [Populus alba x Populus x berolinensis]|uniref:Uncharacterized protein n=1 Tax=Populus alba x Populus x berolinensis TaxID=444605 RepID=A0AAD6RSQ8_9ROSI|nr:hypothetical protein NC653_003786 [Populus alba x Populus x berolinensis]
MRRKAVAICLHHMGEDCDWFCSDVLGQLVKLDVRKQNSMENGFVSRNEVEKILRGSLQSQIPGMSSKVLENIEASDLVMMMLKLELCYEQNPSDPNSLLLIPSILEEGRGKPQRWEVLHRRYNDLYNLAVELDVPPDNPDGGDHTGNELEKVDPSFAGIAKGVEQVLQRLKIIEQEIKDLKQEIQGLKYYEHRLLIELHRKVNYLVNYNIQVEERKVPNMFFFVRTENYSRRLITNMISGMTALRLHMLCEFRGEMHVVEDQIGCEMMQVDNIAVKSLAPYMKKFMKLLTFALKIGAHLAAGMGEMIPDLSREVSHLSGSSLMYGAAGTVAAGAVGAAALGRIQGSRNRSRAAESSRNIQQDVKAAQQWVVDFLRDRRCSTGKDIAEKFALWRVRYRDDGQIAWICRRHMAIRCNEIIEVPI